MTRNEFIADKAAYFLPRIASTTSERTKRGSETFSTNCRRDYLDVEERDVATSVRVAKMLAVELEKTNCAPWMA